MRGARAVVRMMRWAVAFAFTQLVEVPVYLAAMRRQRFDARRAVRFCAAFGASALTHPIVWFVFPRLLSRQGYWTLFAAAEAFAVVAEGCYLGLFGLRRAFRWSLCANALSVGLGLALRSCVGWP